MTTLNNNLPQKPEDCKLNHLGGRCFIVGFCEMNLKMKHCPKNYTHLYIFDENYNNGV